MIIAAIKTKTGVKFEALNFVIQNVQGRYLQLLSKEIQLFFTIERTYLNYSYYRGLYFNLHLWQKYLPNYEAFDTLISKASDILKEYKMVYSNEQDMINGMLE